jgi:hypothetical protein
MVSGHPGVIENEIGRPAILQLGVAVLVVVSVGLFPAQIQAGGSRCSAIECAQLPRTGLEVYWAPPTLVIIRNHVPLVLRTCDRRPGENRVWDCQSHLTGGTATPSSLDTLWSWVLEPEPDPDEGY